MSGDLLLVGSEVPQDKQEFNKKYVVGPAGQVQFVTAQTPWEVPGLLDDEEAKESFDV